MRSPPSDAPVCSSPPTSESSRLGAARIEQAVLDHEPALLAPMAGAIGLGPANLPAPLTAIVGRQLELSVIGSVLVAERLVTLTGVGGIGKTRLALELAIHASGRYAAGPYFVDLAPIADVGLAPGAVATALGVAVEPNQVVTTAIGAVLGERDVVLLVDNCEHLLPGIADLVVELLATNSGVRVLATSREPLGVPGERTCPIDPLSVPPADASVEQIGASDADALLLARLPLNLTTGPLTPDELVAVGAICRAVAGIPLGIELAAARCRTLSLPELAQRLERSIHELEPVRHGVVARHRTLGAALDWGFALLSPLARDALLAMSVFAGGCDASAFVRICVDAPNSGDELLDELVRTSFVTVEHDGRTRYRLLEPVRHYARDLLDAAGGAAERRRHLAHYLDLARTLTNDIDQIGFDTRWDEVKLELGNFRAALDWSVGDPPSIDSGLRLASRLWDLWASEPQHDEGLIRLVGLLATGGGSASARSEAAYAAGFLAANILGDTGRGLELWRQALDEAAAGADRPGEVRVRRILAICALTSATSLRPRTTSSAPSRSPSPTATRSSTPIVSSPSASCSRRSVSWRTPLDRSRTCSPVTPAMRCPSPRTPTSSWPRSGFVRVATRRRPPPWSRCSPSGDHTRCPSSRSWRTSRWSASVAPPATPPRPARTWPRPKR